MMNTQGDKGKEFFELLQLININPHDGMEKFHNKYAKRITVTAKNYFKDDSIVREIENDVYVKVWELSKNPRIIEYPDAWVYVVTANCAKSRLRKWQRKRMLPLKDSIEDTRDEIQDFIDLEAFNFLIKGLSEIEQEIITHRFVSKYTLEEIAEAIGKKTSTVSSIYYRAIEKIRIKAEKFTKNA